MSLQAIIIRVEGGLVETDEIQRRALLRLVSELGYDWPCERSDFAALVDLPSREQRVERLIVDNLARFSAPPDLQPLITAMQRRLGSLVEEIIAEGPLQPRPGIRDLIIAARNEGVRIAIVATTPRGELQRLLEATLGANLAQVDAIVAAEAPYKLAEAYRSALAGLGVAPEGCLAIEATPPGHKAAREEGLATLVTRGAYARAESFEDALFILDSLPKLLPAAPAGTGPFTPQQRLELIAAVQRLHAGIIDLDGAFDRSEDMKVSEILKTKGSAVKSISGSETIWALSHRLRTDAIGALVVLRDGVIEGIISERDVARGLAEFGSTLPSKLVSELMTRTVITCSPSDSVTGISRIMTQRRIRHLPVVEGGKIIGLISIGDVLNHRLDQMQQEVNVLRDIAIAKS